MPANPRHNILVVLFDKAPALAGDLSDMPILAALAGQSAAFPNTYAPSPQASPARASLFTGRDPFVHGLWCDGVSLPKSEETFAQALRRVGYDSWLIGRRHLAGVSHWTTEHCARDEYSTLEWAHGPLHRSRQNAYLNWLQDAEPEIYSDIFPKQPDPDATEIAPEHRAAMAALPEDLSFNHWVGQRAVAQMAWATPHLGIVGFVTGQDMGAGAVEQGIDHQSLRQADAALGCILQAVDEETFVIITAAQGPGTPGAPLAEAAIRVPLLIKGPDIPGRTSNDPVSLTDIAPTLFDLAGLPPTSRHQGTSLRAVLNETQTARGWALSRLRAPNTQPQTALRQGRWKLVVPHGGAGDMRLYDLESDPNERQNLAQQNAHAATLETMLDTMIDARVALENRTEPRIASF